jgi:hypothetical protein
MARAWEFDRRARALAPAASSAWEALLAQLRHLVGEALDWPSAVPIRENCPIGFVEPSTMS